MFERTGIREGMVVRSADGEKLGKVFAVGDDAFHIEKGLFFPKDYVASFSDIRDIRDGELILVHGRESLRSADDASFSSSRDSAPRSSVAALGAARGTELNASAGFDAPSGARQRPQREREVSAPLREEEPEVRKRVASETDVDEAERGRPGFSAPDDDPLKRY